MFDLRDIIFFITTTLLLEKSPIISKKIIKFCVWSLPEINRQRYEHDWLSTLDYVDKPLSKLIFAIEILFRVPSVRSSLGVIPISFRLPMMILAILHLIALFFVLPATLMVHSYPSLKTFTENSVNILSYLSTFSGLIAFLRFKEFNFNKLGKIIFLVVPVVVFILTCNPWSIASDLAHGNYPVEMFYLAFSISLLGAFDPSHNRKVRT